MNAPSPALRRTILAVLTLVAVCALPRAAGAEDGQSKSPSVKIGAAVYQLPATSDTYDLRIPITLESVDPAKITFQKVSITHEGLSSSAFLDAVTLKMEPASADRVPAILLTADLAKMTQWGDYSVQAVPVHDGTPLAPFEITLRRPTATLGVPAKVTVLRTRWFWGLPETDGDALVFEETSRLSWIRGVTVSNPAVHGDQKAEGGNQIQIGFPAEGLPAGGQVQASYSLPNDLPLGTTTASARIFSPQLANPVSVLFEIRERRSPWTVVWLLVGGLLLGYFANTYLQSRIALGRARAKGFEVYDHIILERGKSEDRRFRKVLDAALGELASHLRSDDAAAVTTATQTANTALETAAKDLQESLDAAGTAYETFAAVVKSRWAVPPAAVPAVERARADLDEVKKRLDRGDPTGAGELSDAARIRLATGLADGTGSWIPAEKSYLEAIAAMSGVPADVRVKAVETVTEVGKILDAAWFTEVAPDVEALKAALQALHKARHDVGASIDQLGRWLAQVVAATRAALEKGIVRDQEALSALDRVVRATAETIKAGVDRPDTAIASVAPLGSALREAFVNAVERQLPADTKPERRAEVQKLLGAGRYVEGATLAAAPPPPEGVLPQDMDQSNTAGKVALSLATWSAEAAAYPESPGVARPDHEVGGAMTLHDLRARTFLELLWAGALRTTIAGALIVLIGFLLMAKTFIGTPEEMAGIFLWAFGLDVTLETVIQKALPLLPKV